MDIILSSRRWDTDRSGSGVFVMRMELKMVGCIFYFFSCCPAQLFAWVARWIIDFSRWFNAHSTIFFFFKSFALFYLFSPFNCIDKLNELEMKMCSIEMVVIAVYFTNFLIIWTITNSTTAEKSLEANHFTLFQCSTVMYRFKIILDVEVSMFRKTYK